MTPRCSGATSSTAALAERTRANSGLLRGGGRAPGAAVPPDGGALRARRAPDRVRALAGRALGRPPRGGRVRAPGDRRQAGAARARRWRARAARSRSRSRCWPSPTTSRSASASRTSRVRALGRRARARLPDARLRAGRRRRVGVRAAEPATPSIRQELVETLYHVLWELVHVFFDHRGLLEGRDARRTHDTGASSFLYPFLAEGEHDLEAVVEDVRRSVLAKAEEVGELRAQTLDGQPRGAARRRRRRSAPTSRPAAACSRSATAAPPPTRWTWWPTSAARPIRAGGRDARST